MNLEDLFIRDVFFSRHKANPGLSFEFCNKFWITTKYGLSFSKRPAAPISLPSVLASVEYLKNARERDLMTKGRLLVEAIKCLDLTTLSGDDSFSNLQRLCSRATNPIQEDILLRLGVDPSEIHCAAVCVYPTKASDCVNFLHKIKSPVKVATVATGFPCGQTHWPGRLHEITSCYQDGAREFDVVIRRDLVLRGEWEELYRELREMRFCCHGGLMKVIIGAGELGSLTNIYKASMVCMSAGADFIKTSTGKESVNATLPIGLVMARAIKDYYRKTGFKVGLKPAGGIRTAEDVLLWEELVLKELGPEWLTPKLFRIGASSLLGNIERTIAQSLYGPEEPGFPYF